MSPTVRCSFYPYLVKIRYLIALCDHYSSILLGFEDYLRIINNNIDVKGAIECIDTVF